MTWTQFRERNAFMADLIERAEVDPDSALCFDDDRSEVQRLFGGEEGLLLSLQHRWMTTLAAKLDQASHEDTPTERVRAELAAAQPGLRALLDAAARRSVRVRSSQQGERHLLDLYGGSGDGQQTVA